MARRRESGAVEARPVARAERHPGDATANAQLRQ